MPIKDARPIPIKDNNLDESAQFASAARPGPAPWRLQWQGWQGWRPALLIALVAVAAGAAAGTLFYPLFRDDYQLDQAVLAVALDWRDFGLERARERLSLEFADRSIHQARPADCRFDDGDDVRTVLCTWGVEIALPGESTLPLSFLSSATIDRDGDLK